MSTLEELADRVERLLVRYEELKRTHELLQQHCTTVSADRDNLRSRLGAARGRIDTLLARLHAEQPERPPLTGETVDGSDE